MAECKSCHAAIRWGRTTQGKGVPLDPEPVSDGNLVLDTEVGMTLVDGDPLSELPVRHLRRGEQAPVGVPRYRSHFVTCPDADSWRGQGRDARARA